MNGYQRLYDSLHDAAALVSAVHSSNNTKECDRLFALLNEATDIVSSMSDQVLDAKDRV